MASRAPTSSVYYVHDRRAAPVVSVATLLIGGARLLLVTSAEHIELSVGRLCCSQSRHGTSFQAVADFCVRVVQPYSITLFGLLPYPHVKGAGIGNSGTCPKLS